MTSLLEYGWYEPFSRNCKPSIDLLILFFAPLKTRFLSKNLRESLSWYFIFCFLLNYFDCSSWSFFWFILSYVAWFLTKTKFPFSSRRFPPSSTLYLFSFKELYYFFGGYSYFSPGVVKDLITCSWSLFSLYFFNLRNFFNCSTSGLSC